MAAQHMALDSFWVDKTKYDDAERAYYEGQRTESLTPLADEVARARQRLNEIRENIADESKAVTAPSVQPVKTVEPENKNNAEESKPLPAQEKETPTVCSSLSSMSLDVGAVKFLEKKVTDFEKVMEKFQTQLNLLDTRLSSIESSIGGSCPAKKESACPKPVCPKPAADDEDDDVDLFGSDSEDDDTAAKVKEERLAAYHAKKSKKPALIAKSSIILDVKPWDDETDMKLLEAEVRKIVMEGLLWGASKLVPLAYGIHKLQINCVVEDDKVSIDLLQETIEAIEDYVQSVDIAAFNKI